MNMNADLNLNVTQRSEKDMPMNKTTRVGHRWLSLLIALAVTAVPLAAQAQRKSPLADAPAIRKKYELRATRLEIGAGFGSTINQDFYHTMFFNLKLGFHLTDWLAISGFASFGVANINTTFHNDLVNTLSANMPSVVSEPTKSDAVNSMQKISGMYGLQAEITPFAGKYSLAGVLFAHYDFYGFGGLGLISVAPTDAGITPCAGSNPNDPKTSGAAYFCGVSGTKLGANFGLGLHSYFNNWMALNIELRDILAKLNPSGRDTNGDLHATTADLSWTHTVSIAANLVFYLPSTPGISL
jgi:outer membrane beta-barrel protein